jgi:hypothetical protein
VAEPGAGPLHEWLAAKLERPAQPGPAVAAVDSNGAILAAAMFHSYTERNIFVDIAIERKAAAPLLLWAIGDYAFRQLACARLTFTADSNNLPAIDLHRRMGAEVEAVLRGAAKDGNDIRISVLWHDCAFWRRLNGRKSKHSRDA